MATNTPNLGQRVGKAVSGSRAVIPQGQGVVNAAKGKQKGLTEGATLGNRALAHPGQTTINSQPVPPGTPR